MAPRLLLLFNHHLTREQQEDAYRSLQIGGIVQPAASIQLMWSQIPADMSSINEYLQPIRDWLSSTAAGGDYVLIQGDFGACYLMARFAFERGLIPLYSTTRRQAVEERQSNGCVKLVHHFQHQRFRRYGL
ncbi:CRISPR-associated protein Csx20 [Desulfoferrobacter suflitae]|uniref:CRISPR-associated protein Csx20 n=1 Tax=Desulfoferrobacter suflitae TaxID=2865782 RepID=UPI0021644659|nr:CRISPR-associated protein Csx20 [Desulfoferrobacter suflitae]MCK8603008.1 CRISPR-associated protein Csx20 [Desulfoferrobacter suflitae]